MKLAPLCLAFCLGASALLSACAAPGGQDTAAHTAGAAVTPVYSPASTPTPSPTPTPEPEPSITQAQLDGAVAAAGEAHGAMGVQAAVIEGGQVALQSAWGWAVRDSVAMTPEHKLRCASLTKVAVGLSAALLLDGGVVEPDADIARYWGSPVVNPSYPDTPVTVDSLLTHTSSLIDSTSLSALKGTAARARLAGSGYRAVRPGDLSGWAYNNYGFSVLGMTLELAAGQVLDDVLDEGLLTPLGVDAAFEPGSVEHTQLLAPLYQGGGVSRTVGEMLGYVCYPQPGYRGNFFAGGFTCSAGDMAQLTALLARDGEYQGEQLLSPEAVAYLETPLAQPVTHKESTFCQCRPLRLQYGMYGREAIYYHTGSAYGFYGLLSYDPAAGDGVVVFTTGADGVTDEYGVYAVCGEIARAVYSPAQEGGI